MLFDHVKAKEVFVRISKIQLISPTITLTCVLGGQSLQIKCIVDCGAITAGVLVGGQLRVFLMIDQQ